MHILLPECSASLHTSAIFSSVRRSAYPTVVLVLITYICTPELPLPPKPESCRFGHLRRDEDRRIYNLRLSMGFGALLESGCEFWTKLLYVSWRVLRVDRRFQSGTLLLISKWVDGCWWLQLFAPWKGMILSYWSNYGDCLGHFLLCVDGSVLSDQFGGVVPPWSGCRPRF